MSRSEQLNWRLQRPPQASARVARGAAWPGCEPRESRERDKHGPDLELMKHTSTVSPQPKHAVLETKAEARLNIKITRIKSCNPTKLNKKTLMSDKQIETVLDQTEKCINVCLCTCFWSQINSSSETVRKC